MQRPHTITPARLLMIHLNTKIAQSAFCSTQYPQRRTLERLTFLTQQDEAATAQREEFSRMSLILKCPIRPFQLPMNSPPTPQHLPILPCALLTLSPCKPLSPRAGRISPESSPSQQRAAQSHTSPSSSLGFPPELTPKKWSFHIHSNRDSSSCWLLAGARSYLHTPGCCCCSCIFCFAPLRGCSNSCFVSWESRTGLFSVPQSKQHHFLPFLLLCTKRTTENSVIN